MAKRTYAASDVLRIVRYAREFGTGAAAAKFVVDRSTIRRWRSSLGDDPERHQSAAASSKEQASAVAYSERHGVAAAAAKFGVSSNNIRLWRSKLSASTPRKTYDKQTRKHALRIADSDGVAAAAREIGVSIARIMAWQDAASRAVIVRPILSLAQKETLRAGAISLAKKIGVADAARQLSLSYTTLRSWVIADKKKCPT